MKFSDIEESRWEELKPYLDTCLLPVTVLLGNETPWQTTKALEELRDLMDAIENPYRGRIVAYPAYHYVSDDQYSLSQVKHICRQLRAVGFRYIIIAYRELIPQPIVNDPNPDHNEVFSYRDYDGLSLEDMKSNIRERIIQMWGRNSE
jgi:hypothetical protein